MNFACENPAGNADDSGAAQDAIRAQVIDQTKCVVVKVGTRVLTTNEGKLDLARVDLLAAQLARIADSGRHVIMVSSGAVGAGVAKLGLPTRPVGIARLQAVAAIGQADLIKAYEKSLLRHGYQAAQVLLTKSDLRRRSGYLHVRNALNGIHEFGAIAVVNENDSVAVAELKTTFGDNDRLAAHVAGLFNDALLILLTDVHGLYDGHPDNRDSKKIEVVRDLDGDVMSMAEDKNSAVSKGGMEGKLRASRLANSHGHPTIIGPGRQDDVLDRIFAGERVGTLFIPPKRTLRGRRRWIGSAAVVAGSLYLDDGASRAICNQGRSLLAVGIERVEGTFSHGDVVSLIDRNEQEIARGLVNYRSHEISLIAGRSNAEIESILGHRPYENVIHRNNLVLRNLAETDVTEH
ncbi:glutamate 5-kinase [Rhodopirellula sallentina]|uniref:Glutamate 5-kinase n=1 Tax=Rhodopirellula sallentina SM41 TaxID=1263870 RepID=M5UIC5_9BACT|nr:glutamate 5-kinase [Rhodopirellula sallentina]EMI55763.1 gamma-glutamyl kinase [Rhodopirellula sallentina SM41]